MSIDTKTAVTNEIIILLYYRN